MKKYDPYIPMTERASTGLDDVRFWYQSIMLRDCYSQTNVVFDTRTGHQDYHNCRQERAQAGRHERLLPCLQKVSMQFLVHLRVRVQAYQANSDQCRTCVPSNERELIREPVEWQIVPSFVSESTIEL